MALTSNQSYGVHPGKLAIGDFVDTAASPDAVAVEVGFAPRYIKMINETTVQVQEWFSSMGAADAVKTVNHDDTQISKITSGGITVVADLVTFPAPAQNDVVRWLALG